MAQLNEARNCLHDKSFKTNGFRTDRLIPSMGWVWMFPGLHNISFTWKNSWYGTLDSPIRHLTSEEQVTEPLWQELLKIKQSSSQWVLKSDNLILQNVFFAQSEVNIKPVATQSHTFWLVNLTSVSFIICDTDYFELVLEIVTRQTDDLNSMATLCLYTQYIFLSTGQYARWATKLTNTDF